MLPLLISTIFLFPYEKTELSRDVGNRTIVSIPQIESPSMKNSIKNVFGVPFGLDWYYVCFEDTGSYVEFVGVGDPEAITSRMDFEVDFNNKINLTINQGSSSCTLVRSDERFEYDWKIGTTITVRPSGSMPYLPVYTIHTRTTSYAIPEPNGIFVKVILFLISWCSLCWLATRLMKMIKFGICES